MNVSLLMARMWLRDRAEDFVRWLAYLLPRKIAYWSFIRVTAEAATTGKYSNTHPDQLSVMEALKRYEG